MNEQFFFDLSDQEIEDIEAADLWAANDLFEESASDLDLLANEEVIDF